MFSGTSFVFPNRIMQQIMSVEKLASSKTTVHTGICLSRTLAGLKEVSTATYVWDPSALPHKETYRSDFMCSEASFSQR
jgi:hypothetical protein